MEKEDTTLIGIDTYDPRNFRELFGYSFKTGKNLYAITYGNGNLKNQKEGTSHRIVMLAGVETSTYRQVRKVLETRGGVDGIDNLIALVDQFGMRPASGLHLMAIYHPEEKDLNGTALTSVVKKIILPNILPDSSRTEQPPQGNQIQEPLHFPASSLRTA